MVLSGRRGGQWRGGGGGGVGVDACCPVFGVEKDALVVEVGHYIKLRVGISGWVSGEEGQMETWVLGCVK